MTMQNSQTTQYWCKCDEPGCNRRSPASGHPNNVIADAVRLGWALVENGKRNICPECRFLLSMTEHEPDLCPKR